MIPVPLCSTTIFSLHNYFLLKYKLWMVSLWGRRKRMRVWFLPWRVAGQFSNQVCSTFGPSCAIFKYIQNIIQMIHLLSSIDAITLDTLLKCRWSPANAINPALEPFVHNQRLPLGYLAIRFGYGSRTLKSPPHPTSCSRYRKMG